MKISTEERTISLAWFKTFSLKIMEWNRFCIKTRVKIIKTPDRKTNSTEKWGTEWRLNWMQHLQLYLTIWPNPRTMHHYLKLMWKFHRFAAGNKNQKAFCVNHLQICSVSSYSGYFDYKHAIQHEKSVFVRKVWLFEKSLQCKMQ